MALQVFFQRRINGVFFILKARPADFILMGVCKTFNLLWVCGIGLLRGDIAPDKCLTSNFKGPLMPCRIASAFSQFCLDSVNCNCALVKALTPCLMIVYRVPNFNVNSWHSVSVRTPSPYVPTLRYLPWAVCSFFHPLCLKRHERRKAWFYSSVNPFGILTTGVQPSVTSPLRSFSPFNHTSTMSFPPYHLRNSGSTCRLLVDR